MKSYILTISLILSILTYINIIHCTKKDEKSSSSSISTAELSSIKQAEVQKDKFYIEPYLQNVFGNGISILWWTYKQPEKSYVIYGLDTTNTEKSTVEYYPEVRKYLNIVRLTGLKPNTTYKYQSVSDSYISNNYTFKTSSINNEDVHFCLLGDGRTDDIFIVANHQRILEHILLKKPDFVLYNGDMVKNGDNYHWDIFFRNIMTKTVNGSIISSIIPFFYSVGNHEISDPVNQGYETGGLLNTMKRYKAFIDVPSNNSINPDWEERYYSFKYGPASFIVLDSNNTSDDKYDNCSSIPDNVTPDWEPGSEQYKWLVNQLDIASSSSAFTFVMFHHAPYTKGSHGSIDDRHSGYHLRVLDSLFRSKGVDGAFVAHDHLVERCLTGPEGFWNKFDETDPNNLNYFVQGNGGEGARTPQIGWENWMQIPNAPKGSYYSRYFYDWESTTARSFSDIILHYVGDNVWQATFKVIKVQDDNVESIHDEISFTRSMPF